jgi:hypothetical protein
VIIACVCTGCKRFRTQAVVSIVSLIDLSFMENGISGISRDPYECPSDCGARGVGCHARLGVFQAGAGRRAISVERLPPSALQVLWHALMPHAFTIAFDVWDDDAACEVVVVGANTGSFFGLQKNIMSVLGLNRSIRHSLGCHSPSVSSSPVR